MKPWGHLRLIASGARSGLLIADIPSRFQFWIRAALALALGAASPLARAVGDEQTRQVRKKNADANNSALAPAGMVLIPSGSYAPILRGKDEPEKVAVAAFWLDARPVTNGEFLEFVRANPKWRRGNVSPLFADEGYLSHWAGELELGAQAPVDSPVVRVSWFAARVFAAWQGKRLPTTAEWERAAAAGFTTEHGPTEPGFMSAALGWFAQPTPSPLPSVGMGRPNIYGARDMLTLVWEWVDDFNTAMVTGESRGDTGLERTLFCGAGAAGARDLTNYPAFMRAGMRSSLRANYVVPNLGFRCAHSP